MRAILVASLLIGLAFAGCLSETPAETNTLANNSTAGIDITKDRPAPTAGDVVTGPAAAPDLDATLEAAPVLVPGEWWRIKFRSPLDGIEVEFVRVMAKVDGDHYVFGMPHEGWYKEAVIYHTPAFGDVNRADLSYETHDVLFQPLKFPLRDGDTWKTRFSGSGELTATVKVVDTYVAEITFTNANGAPQMKAVYDARMHEVVSIDHFTVQFEVVEHGYDFQGWVTVPRGEDLVFFHGRFAGAYNVRGPTSAPALIEELVIEQDYNRVTFVQIVGLNPFMGLMPAGGQESHGKGVYRATVTDPDGNKHATEVIAGQGYKIQFFENSNPKGKWTFEHVAGGPGMAFTEGIAYHQYDIHLPDGRIRSDHSHEVVR